MNIPMLNAIRIAIETAIIGFVSCCVTMLDFETIDRASLLPI
jgi:hypothetical protein